MNFDYTTKEELFGRVEELQYEIQVIGTENDMLKAELIHLQMQLKLSKVENPTPIWRQEYE